jgi:hypothetical protein
MTLGGAVLNGSTKSTHAATTSYEGRPEGWALLVLATASAKSTSCGNVVRSVVPQ